ncbi:MAG: hypothetical protein GY749_35250 [Desulfobacteraceae bacterium]|nr:hypothetical protein [Desulfobacteraceae bacterium]
MLISGSRSYQGYITANAYEGDGGAVFIRTNSYLRSADSAVTASSERGNDGTVTVDAPDTDITNLVSLPENLLDVSADFTPRKKCSDYRPEP